MPQRWQRFSPLPQRTLHQRPDIQWLRLPKIYSSTRHPLQHAFIASKSSVDPTCFTMAMKSLEWRSVMALEFDAIQQNGTWTVVPAKPNMNIVGCKWVYKLKYKADGSFEHYKAHLVAKGFINSQVLILLRPPAQSPARPQCVYALFSLAVRFD